MASLVVADTDIVIDFLRGKGAWVQVVRDLIGGRRLRLTAVTAFELRVGTAFHDRSADILKLLKSRTLALDPTAALLAGEVADDLRSRGTPIGFADCLQAGVCLRHALPLVTRNRKHFERIAGLELVEP